jgi:phosphoglycolate phosphatase-like HAD superfamily hydrolase
MYRAVIFDVDGTLVDSNNAHASAWVQAITESGRHVEFSRVRPLIGMGGDKLLPEVAGISADSPEGTAIAERRGEIFKGQYLPHLQPTRGAQRLLEWLRDDRKKLVAASSAEDDELQDLLKVAGALELIDSTTSSDDAERSKPDPDIVRAALGRTGCRAAEVIMIGDTPYDVEAALRTGIEIIALRSGGWSDQELTGAIAVYADPADLLLHYDLSPFRRPLPLRSA